jgi:excisionase family DNA binding protein
MQTQERRFMTLQEVAQLWECSKTTVVGWADKGQIPSVRMPGGKRKYERAKIMADFDARRNGHGIVKGE